MEVGVELRKAMQHHLESLLELFGDNDDLKATAQKIADLIDGGAEGTVARASTFLSSARAVHDGLRSVAAGVSKEDNGIFYSRWKTRRIVMADSSADPDVVQRVVEGIIRADYGGDGAAYAAAVEDYKRGVSYTDEPGARAVQPVLSNRRGVNTGGGPASPGYQPGPGYQVPAPGSSAADPGYTPPRTVAKSDEERRAQRGLEILRSIEGGYSEVDALLAKSDGGELASAALAREISSLISKKQERSDAFAQIYEWHRQLVSHGSLWTVADMRAALSKGGSFVDEVEAMSKAEREKVLADPALMEEYRAAFHRRASMGGDVG